MSPTLTTVLAWAGLLLLTTTVVLLPMLPALKEWWRPSDVVPLPIDHADAQDPTWLATSFAARLSEALAQRQPRLGRSPIARAPADARWPLKDGELKSGTSRRVWHAQGDTVLPQEINFLAEVAAPGRLETAPGRTYRALWSGAQLDIATRSTVLRWAHGRVVAVDGGCRLAGRVTASESIAVWGRSFFTRLHAPTICFGTWPGAARRQPAPPALRPRVGDLPPPVKWNPVAHRGTCDESLELAEWSAWKGDLVCRGHLVLGAGSLADGSLKAHGELWLDPHCRVTGSLVAEGRIDLAEHCQVGGSVISETEVVLREGCTIGTPERPATVAAPRIVVGPGVVVHGTLWAAERGETRHDLPAPYDIEPPADSGFIHHHWPQPGLA